MNKIIKWADSVVTLYMYWVISILIVFMIFSFTTWIVWMFDKIPDFLSWSVEPKKFLEDKILHTIAFSIILVKAYMILVSYAKFKHVSIKYIVEISIIASAVEVIFNSWNYETLWIAILWGFWIINLIIYMIFYKNFEKMSFEEV